MHIYIIKPGIHTTVQDDGRTGYRALGIAPGGVMDVFAAAMARRLAGNQAGEAVLEMHYPAPELLFEADCLLGIAGGNFDMHINSQPAANWQSHFVKAGSVVSFHSLKKGFRAYLSVQGGFAANAWLGSYATHTVAGMGGYQGRALQKGDRLLLNLSVPAHLKQYKAVTRPEKIAAVYGNSNYIDCIEGPEFDNLHTSAKEILRQGKGGFYINSGSNRMACLLTGTALAVHTQAATMLSSAVSFGTVQLLPNGNPLVLMAAHQATGGYPRILTVVAAALPLLAQMRPGAKIRFRLLSLQQAEDKLLALQGLLQPVATTYSPANGI